MDDARIRQLLVLACKAAILAVWVRSQVDYKPALAAFERAVDDDKTKW